jgi:hypothetical protein
MAFATRPPRRRSLPQPHRGQRSRLSLTSMWPACPALLFCRAAHDHPHTGQSRSGAPGQVAQWSRPCNAPQRRSACRAAMPFVKLQPVTEQSRSEPSRRGSSRYKPVRGWATPPQMLRAQRDQPVLHKGPHDATPTEPASRIAQRGAGVTTKRICWSGIGACRFLVGSAHGPERPAPGRLSSLRQVMDRLVPPCRYRLSCRRFPMNRRIGHQRGDKLSNTVVSGMFQSRQKA